MQNGNGKLLILAALLGVLTVPGIGRSQSDEAVVLLASTSMHESERAALDAVLETLVAELGPGDELGAVLFSDIVEHVVPLSAASAAVKEEIRTALASVSVSAEINGAIGFDRAVDELADADAERSLIVFSSLGVALSDAQKAGQFTRWLDSALLPRAARSDIDLLIYSHAPVSASVRSFVEQRPSSRLSSVADERSDASVVALDHLGLRPDLAALTDSPTPESELDVAALDTDAAAVEADLVVADAAGVDTEGQPSSTEVPTRLGPVDGTADGASRPLDVTDPASVAEAERVPAGQTDGPASAGSSADALTSAPAANWSDRLTRLMSVPVMALSGLVFLLVIVAIVVVIRRSAQRSARRPSRKTARTGRNRGRRAETAREIGRSWDEDPLDDVFASRKADGGDGFDAPADDLGSRGTEDDSTVFMPPKRPAREGNAGRPEPKDPGQELEDITRERQSQYDFE